MPDATPKHSRQTLKILRQTLKWLKTRREPNEELIRSVEEALARAKAS